MTPIQKEIILSAITHNTETGTSSADWIIPVMVTESGLERGGLTLGLTTEQYTALQGRGFQRFYRLTIEPID